jgi:hypothetical protein
MLLRYLEPTCDGCVDLEQVGLLVQDLASPADGSGYAKAEARRSESFPGHTEPAHDNALAEDEERLLFRQATLAIEVVLEEGDIGLCPVAIHVELLVSRECVRRCLDLESSGGARCRRDTKISRLLGRSSRPGEASSRARPVRPDGSISPTKGRGNTHVLDDTLLRANNCAVLHLVLGKVDRRLLGGQGVGGKRVEGGRSKRRKFQPTRPSSHRSRGRPKVAWSAPVHVRR